MKINN
jgi:hypothetical protein